MAPLCEFLFYTALPPGTQRANMPRTVLHAAVPHDTLAAAPRALVKKNRRARGDGPQSAEVGVVRASNEHRKHRRPTAGQTQSAFFLHYEE